MDKNSETVRIKEMIDVVMKVTRGDYSAQLELSDRNDNIDSLAKGLNMMIKDIRTRSEELIKFNKKHKTQNDKLLKSKAIVEESERTLKSIIENQGEGFGITDSEENFLFANAAAEEIFGVPRNTLIGENLRAYFDKEQFGKIKQQTEMRKAGNNSTYELTIIRPDKQKRELLVTATPDFDKNKKFQGTIGAFRDITNLKNTEVTLKNINKTLEQRVEERTKRLTESEQKFRNLFNQNPISLWEGDISEILKFVEAKKKDGITAFIKYIDNNPEFVFDCASIIKVLKVNRATLDMFKVPSVEYLVANIAKMFTIRTIEIFKRVLVAAAEGETNFREETEFFNFKGEVLSVILQFSIIENSNMLLISITDITENKKAELKIREEEKKYQIVADYTYDWEYWLTPENEFNYISPSCERITGYKPKEFIQNPQLYNNIIINEDQPKWIEHNLNILNHQKESDYLEFQIRNKNGKLRWIGHLCQPMYDKSDNYIGARGTNRDITDYKNIEQNLLETEQKHEKILNAFVDCVYITSPDYTIAYLNRAMTKMIGNNKLGAKCHKAIYNRDEKCDWCIFDELKEKKNITYELQDPVRKRYFTIRNFLLDNNSKLSIYYDTTELKKTEQKLSLHIKQTPLGVIEWDLDFNVNTWNKAAEKIFGYSKHEAIGKSGDFIIPQDKRKYAKDIRKKLIVSKQGKRSIIDSITKYGERINCEWYNTPLIDTNGEIIGVASLIHDITKQKQAENKTLSSEKKFRLLFESANDAILLMDKEKIIDCNKKTLEMFGCSREDIIGQKSYKFSPEVQPDGRESKEKALEKINTSLRGEILTFEWIHSKLNGDTFFTEVSLNSFYLNDKEVIQAIIRDITERKNAENKLLNATIMAEENERSIFSRELHDGLGPLLATIKLYFQWLEDIEDDKKTVKIIKKGIQNSVRAIQTIREISNHLSPKVLNDLGFVLAVESFIDNIKEISKLTINFQYNSQKRIDNFLEITLYRISTELINNTIKYANASSVEIGFNIDEQRNELTFIYEDNGKGFDVGVIQKNNKGFGLKNINDRIKISEGLINITSSIGNGMKIFIKLPMGKV
ncbi:MAG: PAS domain S-box protein [Bacteroidales bacterium]|nr:PAS domain S-box protein [Bacteroidales bacterium]